MALLSILFKINVSLLIFYLVYRLTLRKLTFYNFNRIYLLASIIIAAGIPFVPYYKSAQTSIGKWQSATGINPSIFQNYVSESKNINWTAIASYIYWAGVLIMGSVFLVQLCSLLALYFRSKKTNVWGYEIRTTKETLHPFSFFKSIFVNPQEHSFEALQSILQHENVHAHQWHSFDVLVGEIKRIFCWFNPAAWLMLAAIRENLEFIADRNVLKNGTDKKAYQFTLLAAQQATTNNSLTNNFNFSHLKLRITMMNKTKTSDVHLLKYLLAVPVCTVILILTSTTTKAKNLVIETSQQKVSLQTAKVDSGSKSNGQTAEKLGLRKERQLKEQEQIGTQQYNKIINQEIKIKTDFEVLGNTEKLKQIIAVNNPENKMPVALFEITKDNWHKAEIYETEVMIEPLDSQTLNGSPVRRVTASIRLKDDEERNVSSNKEEPAFYHIYIDGVKQKSNSEFNLNQNNIAVKYLKGQDAKNHDDAVKDGEGVMLITTK